MHTAAVERQGRQRQKQVHAGHIPRQNSELHYNVQDEGEERDGAAHDAANEALLVCCGMLGEGAAGGGGGRRRAHLPVPNLSDDEEDGPSMVEGQTSKDND
jgi:hypothetical protein